MPIYSSEVIEEVVSRNDIVDVISGYIKLKKSGSSYVGLCPFHNEKSPSFSVSGTKQMYHCFGCGVGGNVITFVMEYENFTFPEAVKLLADRAGVDLPVMEYSGDDRRERDIKTKLLEINKIAATFYYHQLKSPAGQDGLVSYTIDGLESLTVDNFKADNFNKTNYKVTELTDQMKISSGSPAYRLITSENWSVVIPLKKDTAKEFQKSNLQNVQVRIDKDSEKMWSAFSVLERDGNFYGVLTFDNSMIRYASERFLNIELILEDECGLKIPKSAVVEEQFFVIPHDYITNGGNSSLEGVMVLDSKGTASFQAVDIYDTSDDGEVYLSRDQLKSGTVIVKPDSSDTYTIDTQKPLKGVYNINKGYAVFKKVSILCESDEYYIVQEGDSYGLSNYDHIVQNGAGVSSDDVVFQ